MSHKAQKATGHKKVYYEKYILWEQFRQAAAAWQGTFFTVVAFNRHFQKAHRDSYCIKDR